MTKYTDLTAAMAILKTAMMATPPSEPSWTLLFHARQHLFRQADTAMRGE